MNRPRNAPPLDPSKLPTLSSGAYKVLALFERSCAYQVRGHWRFLGFRGFVKDRALLSLVEKGLAEWGETRTYPQIRMTEAGRSANRCSRQAATASQRGSKSAESNVTALGLQN